MFITQKIYLLYCVRQQQLATTFAFVNSPLGKQSHVSVNEYVKCVFSKHTCHEFENVVYNMFARFRWSLNVLDPVKIISNKVSKNTQINTLSRYECFSWENCRWGYHMQIYHRLGQMRDETVVCKYDPNCAIQKKQWMAYHILGFGRNISQTNKRLCVFFTTMDKSMRYRQRLYKCDNVCYDRTWGIML